jgi:hypothetical protein
MIIQVVFIIIVGAGVIGILSSLYFFFTSKPQRQVASRFFANLQSGNFAAAYAELGAECQARLPEREFIQTILSWQPNTTVVSHISGDNFAKVKIEKQGYNYQFTYSHTDRSVTVASIITIQGRKISMNAKVKKENNVYKVVSVGLRSPSDMVDIFQG